MKAQAIYKKVTEAILADLKAGTLPWRKSWSCEGAGPAFPTNLRTGIPYSGMNTMLLWLAAKENGYPTNWWATYKQIKELGGFVQRGQTGTPGIRFGTTTVTDSTGEEKTVRFGKGFTLFNLAQIDPEALPKLRSKPLAAYGSAPDGPEFPPIEAAEKLLSDSGATILHGGTRAYFSLGGPPAGGHIQMPDKNRFSRPEDYYATALHELIHWTGAPDRLGRQYGARFGDQAYAFEELVAEMGSAFLYAHLGLEGTPQHSSYIQHWIGILKDDMRAFSTACSAAQAGYEYLIPPEGRDQNFAESQEAAA